MKIVNDLEFEKATSLIEPNIPGQFPRQKPIWIEIYWEDDEATLTAYASDPQVSGMPEYVWNEKADRFALPNNVDASSLVFWACSEDFQEQLKKLIDARDDSESFADEKYEFEHFIELDAPTLDEGCGLWDVDDWLDMSTTLPNTDDPTCHIEDVGGIDAKTTDAQLEKMAKKIEAMADDDNVVFDRDPLDWLEEIRDDCAMYTE